MTSVGGLVPGRPAGSCRDQPVIAGQRPDRDFDLMAQPALGALAVKLDLMRGIGSVRAPANARRCRAAASTYGTVVPAAYHRRRATDYATSLRSGHLTRNALGDPGQPPLKRIVEVDETLLGGRHRRYGHA